MGRALPEIRIRLLGLSGRSAVWLMKFRGKAERIGARQFDEMEIMQPPCNFFFIQ